VSRVGPREPGIVGFAARRSVADLLWLANTRHGPGGHWFARPTVDEGDHDHLRTPAEAVRYLVDHGIDVPAEPPTLDDLAGLGAIREMVRGLRDPSLGWTQDGLAILAGARFQIDARNGIAAEGDGWHAFMADLLLPLLEVVELRDRLRICGNPMCRLVFLDASKSGTRRWCDDAGCGNRNRVRRHRHRATAARDVPGGDGPSTIHA
jgi:CGNR zinc finger